MQPLCNNNVLHKLLNYLDRKGISSSKEIAASQITGFMAFYANSKPKYVATVLYVLRNYFTFLKEGLKCCPYPIWKKEFKLIICNNFHLLFST